MKTFDGMQRWKTVPRYLILFALCALVSCYSPVIVKGPVGPEKLSNVPASGWKRAAGLRLHVFNTGMNRVSAWLVGESDSRWRPAPAFVIEHPRAGLIVFDCGLGPEIGASGEEALHPFVRLVFDSVSYPGRDLGTQMRAAGLDPTAVTRVIFSHLHFDHTGAAPLFKNAAFFVGAETQRAGLARSGGFEPAHLEWISATAWQTIDFENAAEPYATFRRTYDLLGDGSVLLVDGGGHSAGGLAAVLHLPGGPALLAGDEVVHLDWLKSNDVQKIATHPERAAEFRNHVRRLLELAPDLLVFPGHDLPDFAPRRRDVLVHNPEYFEKSKWELDTN